MVKYRTAVCIGKLYIGYNHVCEDCGNEWESSKEDQRCPACGSSATQSTQQR